MCIERIIAVFYSDGYSFPWKNLLNSRVGSMISGECFTNLISKPPASGVLFVILSTLPLSQLLLQTYHLSSPIHVYFV